MDVLIYALSVYWTFQLASRAELFNRPRAWLLNRLHPMLAKPFSCAFCWSWWVGVVFILGLWLSKGVLVISTPVLLATPVINMVLDLVVRSLIRMNELALNSSEQPKWSIRTYERNVVTGTALTETKAGEIVTITTE